MYSRESLMMMTRMLVDRGAVAASPVADFAGPVVPLLAGYCDRRPA